MPYKPINCNFYDILLANATLKKSCKIVYIEQDKTHEVTAIILDIFSRKGAEFMTLDNDIEIRLDKIVSINHQVMPKTKHCKI